MRMRFSATKSSKKQGETRYIYTTYRIFIRIYVAIDLALLQPYVQIASRNLIVIDSSRVAP